MTVIYPTMYLYIFMNVPDGVYTFVYEASKGNRKRYELRNGFKEHAVQMEIKTEHKKLNE